MTVRGPSGMTIERLCQIVGYRLSEEQLAAVTADLDQPLRIVAGAGSGKTSVMAARVVWAVGRGHVRPGEVLGLTFTTKAAAELGARIRRMLGFLHDGDDLEGDGNGEPLVTTYHSFAHRLVSEQGLRIGVEPGARLLADNETALLAYRVLTNTDLPLAGLASGPAALVADVVALDQQLAEHVVTTQSLRDHDRRLIEAIDALPKSVAADRKAREAATLRLQLANAVDELRASKAAADVVDFADLLRFGVEVAELAHVGAMERDRWPMVLLDEYQDTSVVQSRMLAGLFGGGHPVTAVGDPLQGIYGWRGASADGMDAFATSFCRTDGDPARSCQLSISHRSGPRILENANRVAAPLRDVHPAVARLEPAILDGGGTRPDGLVAALFATQREEVEWVADRVAEQIGAGTEPGQIAILCRTSASFPDLADELDARGIPSQVSTLDGLFAQPEIIDIISVLQVLHDPSANPAALRVLLGPRWRIGKRDLAILGRRSADIVRLGGGAGQPEVDEHSTLEQRLAQALAGNDPVDIGSLIEAVEDPGSEQRYQYSSQARERFGELIVELDVLRPMIGQPLSDVVSQVIAVLGLEVEVELAARRAIATPRGAGRGRGIAALSTFMQLVSVFADIDGDSSLGGFLAWIRLVARFGGEPTVDVAPSAAAVQILTVHKAKGLEWEVVFTPFMSNQVFPTARPRPRWTVTHGELPHQLRGDRAALPDLSGFGTKNHERFAEQMKDHTEAEERRLAYVALTRPARLLVASGHWWGPSQKTMRGPSGYLAAVRESALECGDVPVWEPMPQDSTNPVLIGAPAYGWPAHPDPGAAGDRAAGAALVLELLDSEDETADEDDDDDESLGQLTSVQQELLRQWDDDVQSLLADSACRDGVTEVDLPQSLSASDVVCIAKDSASFARNLLRPMPRRPSFAASRGTRFHEWVAERFEQRPLFEDIPGAVDADPEVDDDLAELQEAFWRSEFATREPSALEVPFSLVLGGRVVFGRIDAVYRHGSRWQVIDWKTGRDASGDPLQLAVYRAAWAHLKGCDVADIDCAFVYVRSSKTVWLADLPGLPELSHIMTG